MLKLKILFGLRLGSNPFEEKAHMFSASGMSIKHDEAVVQRVREICTQMKMVDSCVLQKRFFSGKRNTD